MLLQFVGRTADVVLPRACQRDAMPQVQFEQCRHPLAVILTGEQVLQFVAQNNVLVDLHFVLQHRYTGTHQVTFALYHTLVVCLVHQQGVQVPYLVHFLVQLEMYIGVVRARPAHVYRPRAGFAQPAHM